LIDFNFETIGFLGLENKSLERSRTSTRHPMWETKISKKEKREKFILTCQADLEKINKLFSRSFLLLLF
jgi:hypothetical protein